jgi:hypothetical protein
MSNVETRITVLEKRADTTDNRLIEMMMSNNRAVEKANDALGKAIEASGVAKSAERVTNDNVVNLKQDMKELKKALTNPLGN